MGKVVKGARLGRDSYFMKAPPALAAAMKLIADETASPPLTPRDATAFDWDSMHEEAAALIQAAAADGERLIRDAQKRASGLIAQALGSRSQIEESARAAGFDRGLEQGRAETQTEMDEMLSTMRGLVEMARVERHKIIEGAEPEILRLSTAIAERILHQHTAIEPKTVLEMTRSAIARLVSRDTVTVRVNPADIELMRENRETFMSMNDIEHLRVIEDQRVDRGGVLLETEAGTIDAKISTQLREVRRILHVQEPIAVAPSLIA
ncbi:MAG: FliH/SctL family protein [Candidatus Eremiobacteraeota bacterium]|nr:FliH/SctL family protein [Candidatus Eremiobacteraeota bacterium]